MLKEKKIDPREFFIGARRSMGEMDGDVKGEKITWDNIIISWVEEILENGKGYEVNTVLKIKTEEFQEVTGETWEDFEEKIPDRFMQQIDVFFGKMRGAKDDRKADVKYFRFVNPTA